MKLGLYKHRYAIAVRTLRALRVLVVVAAVYRLWQLTAAMGPVPGGSHTATAPVGQRVLLDRTGGFDGQWGGQKPKAFEGQGSWPPDHARGSWGPG